MTRPRCRLHEYAPMMRTDTPESRRFWDGALRNTQDLAAWPQWMLDRAGIERPRCTCPEQPSDWEQRFALLEFD